MANIKLKSIIVEQKQQEYHKFMVTLNKTARLIHDGIKQRMQELGHKDV